MIILDLLYRYFERPWIFLIILPLSVILFYLIRKDFINLGFGEDYKKRKKKLRIFVLCSRLLIFILLIIALATPFIQTTKIVQGEPRVKILVDNSTSMELFDLSLVNNLRAELEKKILVDISFMASGEDSALGEGIISNMNKDSNLLLVTDGNNNVGLDFGDVALQSNSLNSSISAIRINPNKYDAAVSIYGPEKTTAGAENSFSIFVQQTEDKKARLIVDIDGGIVFDKIVGAEDIKIKRVFKEGYHKITARLEVQDYFSQNNIYYKTVKVVPKPKVLLISKNLELEQLLGPLYQIDKSNNLDLDFKPYTAIIIDDYSASDLDKYTDQLSNFVSDGNGLFVIGGKNSYDSGNYSGSKFEQLLPVFVAKAGRKKGEMNIVLAIDISGSTGGGFGDYKKVDVEKALAIGMLKTVPLVSNVGLVAFSGFAYKVAELNSLLQQPELEDKISRLQFGGGTQMVEGLRMSIDMLQNKGGSKNIIIISDGNTEGKDKVIAAVKYASSLGINTYAIGVGGDTNKDFMQQVAEMGNGIYFEPDTSQQIKLAFGESEISENKRVFPLVLINKDHFITRGLNIGANIYGFNQVVPKASAKMLVVTDTGDPIVDVWRFGLGRVASLSTDYRFYGVELLGKDNSVLLTKIGNWVVGDPERKNTKFIDVSDGTIGEPIEVIVKSDIQPSSNEIDLYKFEDNLYRGSLNVDKTGFNKILDGVFAVNYDTEYLNIGNNPQLDNLVYSTGGILFEPQNIDGIVEFIKQKSRREVLTNKSYGWIFLLSALIVYLLEVCFRRLFIYRYL